MRRFVLGRSHTLALADLTWAAARKAHKRWMAFVRDVKGHVRFARVFSKAEKYSSGTRTTAVAGFALSKPTTSSLSTITNSSPRASRRGRTRPFRKARLDAILNKAASGQRADLFKVGWLDRVVALKRAHARLGSGRVHDAFRLNAGLLLRLLGLRRAVSLRALARGFVVLFDLAVITYVESLLRIDREWRLSGAGPAPAPPLDSNDVVHQKPRRKSSVVRRAVAIFKMAKCPEARPPPRPPSTTRRRRRTRPSSAFGGADRRPMVPDMLEACAPILVRDYVAKKDLQLSLPLDVTEKRRALLEARQRRRDEAERRERQAVQQDQRARQFDKYLRLLDGVKEEGLCKD